MNLLFLDFDGVINNNQEEISLEALSVLKKNNGIISSQSSSNIIMVYV